MINEILINNIINEAIDNAINESLINEKHKNGYNKEENGNSEKEAADLLRKYLHKKAKHKKSKKVRKMAGGRKTYYDYEKYKSDNKDLSVGDASSIRNTVDMDKTNIASVARDLLPDHTKQGAQSQLRKILNGERPMTQKIASKLEKMISDGEVAMK